MSQHIWIEISSARHMFKYVAGDSGREMCNSHHYAYQCLSFGFCFIIWTVDFFVPTGKAGREAARVKHLVFHPAVGRYIWLVITAP